MMKDIKIQRARSSVLGGMSKGVKQSVLFADK